MPRGVLTLWVYLQLPRSWHTEKDFCGRYHCRYNIKHPHHYCRTFPTGQATMLRRVSLTAGMCLDLIYSALLVLVTANSLKLGRF